MGRALKILLIGLGIWAGLEMYLEGPQNAFGGLFGPSKSAVEAHAQAASTPQRAGNSVRSSLALEHERNERAMPE